MHEDLIGVLEPYVGRDVAEIWVVATAVVRGKEPEAMDAEDITVLVKRVTRSLSSIAPAQVVDRVTTELSAFAQVPN
jgi:hypothetical protein